MRHAPTPKVATLTGLSTETLREWTVRRALIPADVPAKRQGSPAKFSWQTVLVLRVAKVLRNAFHFELQAHVVFFKELRNTLANCSFITLRNKAIILQSNSDWEIVDVAGALPPSDAFVIHLNPHLEVLATGFALPYPTLSAGQLDLFPAQAIHESEAASHRPGKASADILRQARRRSA